MKRLLIFIAILLAGTFLSPLISAQEATPTPTPTPSTSSKAADLQKQINELQGKINDLQSQEKTLSSQIGVMDNQIKLSTLKINAIKAEIDELGKDIDTAIKKIDNIDRSIDDLTKVLVNRVQATYKIGSAPSFQILIASNDISNFVERAKYLRIAQQHDRKLIYETVQAKNDYENQKEIFEDKKAQIEGLKQQLEAQTNELNATKDAKEEVLAATQNDERKYQELLARARAEYEALTGIIAGKGTETELRRVNQGDNIARLISGASCNSSGTHLHFTISNNGSAMNPFDKLKGIDHVNRSGGDPFNPSGDWDWPIDPRIEFNQGYGSDTSYIRSTRFYPFHNGIDISGPSTTVKAVKSGTLYRGSYAGYNGCTLPYVKVHHEDGLDTYYLHVYSL